MTNIIHSRIAWTAFALFAAYWVLAQFVPNPQLMEGLHSVRIAICVVVIIAYMPICIEALRLRKIDRVHQLSLGIVLGWAAVLEGGIWALIWRLAGQPAWMVNSDLNGFFIWQAILGAVLHITAPAALDGVVPRRNWILVGLAFGAGALTASLLLLAKPDLHALAAYLEPYFRE